MSKTKQKRMVAYLLTLSLFGGVAFAETVPDTPATPNSQGAYIYVNDSTITSGSFDIGTVSGWSGTNQGAIVNFYSGKDLTLNSIGEGTQLYSGNKAGTDAGGAIFNGANADQNATITVNGNATFEYNEAGRAGAIYNDCNLVFQNGNVTFTENKGTSNAAGIWAGGGAILNVDGNLSFNRGKVVFEGNEAAGNGGAILSGLYGVRPSSSVNFNTEVEFKNNSSTAAGGALANIGSTVNVDENSGSVSFVGNTAGTDGGAIYNTGSLTLGNGASFTGNSANGNGGAIYNAGDVELSTANGDIVFSGNRANGSNNDIYAAVDSKMNVTGTGNVSIGSGLFTEADSLINVTDTSSMIIGENATADIAGKIKATSDAQLVNKGTMNISGVNLGLLTNENELTIAGENEGDITNNGNFTLSGSNTGVMTNNATMTISGTNSNEVTNNANLTISGTNTGKLINNDGTLTISNTSSAEVINDANMVVSGTSNDELTNNGNLTITNGGEFSGNIIETSADSVITVESGAAFGTTDTIDNGSLTIAQGGKVLGTVDVTDNVVLNVADSAVFDSTGLLVGGDATNGHITGNFNLADTEISFAAGTEFTQDMVISGSSQISTNDSIVKIGDGTSLNTLTLSNGSISAAGGKGFHVTDPATIKLSPDAGKSMTLDENVKGDGNVLVDEKVTQIDNPNYDPSQAGDPGYTEPEKIDKHWGVGTVNITSDNQEFTGNFLQKMGTVIAQAGSKFFGGSTNTVEGGTLVLQNGADLTTDVDVTASATGGYGTVNIYNAIEGVVGEDGINRITADSIANGNDAVISYINSDDTKNNVNITSAGLGLFNGTRVTGDLTLNKGSGVRDLTFGNGSGAESDSIILNEATKLTYKDNAYIKQDSTVSVGKNASLNFANDSTNIVYNPVISSTDESAAINKTGAGSTVIASSMENYHGNVNVLNGMLDLATGEDKYLRNVTVKDAILNVAGNLAVTNEAEDAGNLTVSNGSLFVEKSLEVADKVTITDSNLLVGDHLAIAGATEFNGSDVVVTTDFATMDDLTIDNTKLTVGGESDLEAVTIKGDNSVVKLGKDSLMSELSILDKSVLNTGGNVNISGAMNIGQAGGSDNPTINMMSGAINTINADSIVINSNSNIFFDVDPRSKTTDQIISSNIINNTGAADDPFKLLIGGINFTTSPIDRNVQFDISNLLKDPSGGNANMIQMPDGGFVTNTAMGQYLITSSGAGSPILSADLLALNPQQYRGQVATLASWQNQLVVNNMLFDHMNILTRQLMEEEKTANKYSAAYPQFAPYQYNIKDGSLWYKAYGNFERLSMTKGLSVGNNAYGSLIGADFPLIKLKNGWNLVPTAYIGYNGAHQTFNGVSMYQNGAQLGLMGTAYKGDFITSLLAYGGGYANDMSVRGQYGSGSDTTGNWFAGVASKTAYNIHLPKDFIFQPTFLMSYNAFGSQNWGSNFGNFSMSTGMLNGINVAPGFNLIWNKKTFDIYATAQMVYNVMGGVDGQAGNIDTGYVRMRHSYFEYGLGVSKTFKDRFKGYVQFTIRNGGRTGIGFSGGLQWKIGK